MVRLLVAADPIKDQTFFLSTLNQSQLRRSMFPVGSLTKQQVRQIAVDVGLAEVADKPDVNFYFISDTLKIWLLEGKAYSI